MYKIESFEQYRSIVKAFKAAHSPAATNCYFMPNEVKKYIEKSKLYYSEYDELLCIYVVEKEYDHLYYYCAADSEPLIAKEDKTIVLDFVTRKEKEELLKKEELRFSNAGFERYKYYIRMSRAVETEAVSCKYTLGYGDTVYSSDIRRLWENSLDALSTPLPSEEEMDEMIKSETVYYMLDGEKIIAAVYMDVSGKNCLLQHISVDNSYRKQGLGEIMLKYAFNMVSSHKSVSSCNLWVDIDNTPAFNMYKKNGFTEDGLVSIQYLYK